MTLISTATVGPSGAANFTLNSIPQTGTDLLITISGQGNGGGVGVFLDATINGSTTGFGGRVIDVQGSNRYAYDIGRNIVSLSGPSTGSFSNSTITFLNYTSSTAKRIISESAMETNAASSRMVLTSANWSGTSAITSIVLTPQAGITINEHSTISLYTITRGSGGATAS
jgi:hypothetical protein